MSCFRPLLVIGAPYEVALPRRFGFEKIRRAAEPRAKGKSVLTAGQSHASHRAAKPKPLCQAQEQIPKHKVQGTKFKAQSSKHKVQSRESEIKNHSKNFLIYLSPRP